MHIPTKTIQKIAYCEYINGSGRQSSVVSRWSFAHWFGRSTANDVSSRAPGVMLGGMYVFVVFQRFEVGNDFGARA